MFQADTCLPHLYIEDLQVKQPAQVDPTLPYTGMAKRHFLDALLHLPVGALLLEFSHLKEAALHTTEQWGSGFIYPTHWQTAERGLMGTHSKLWVCWL